MLRSSLFTASAFALVAGASAQSTPQVESATPVTGPVKYAGTYHLATGTWTRGTNTVSNFGQSDNLYSNTAESGFYYGTVGPTGSAAGGQVIDEGHIASSSDDQNGVALMPGSNRDASTVNTVTFGYCDFDTLGPVAGFDLNFYELYAPCTTLLGAGLTPTGSVSVTGFPANGCWIVDIDLTGGNEFNMAHDGDGVHDGTDALDSFGVEWAYTGTGTLGAGLLLTGNPALTDTGWVSGAPVSGSNTFFGEAGGCPGFGSGYDNGDLYWVESTTSFASGCYFFGGYSNPNPLCTDTVATPHGGHYVELSGTDTGPPVGGVISTPGCVGAVNSTTAAGECRAEGFADVASNDVTLIADNMPANQFGLFVNGTVSLGPNLVTVGDGYLCINPGQGSGLGRFNTIKNSGATGEFALSTTAGEWNLAAIPGSSTTYAAMAGTTSIFQAWHRDTVGAGSNVTGSCSVVWQ